MLKPEYIVREKELQDFFGKVFRVEVDRENGYIHIRKVYTGETVEISNQLHTYPLLVTVIQ